MTAKLVVPEAIQLTQVASDPAAVPGKAQLYAKDVSGTAQVFMQDGAGVVTEVGSGGNPTWLVAGSRATHDLNTPIKVVSGFEFDRSQFVFSSIKFRAVGARGNTINGIVELYNLTDAVSVATLTFTSTSPALQESADISGSLPASSKLYEVRIYLAAPFVSGDSIELYSAYLNVLP